MARRAVRTSDFTRDSTIPAKALSGHVWITSQEAAKLLDTTPDAVNYHAKKGRFIRKTDPGRNRWLYSRKYIIDVVQYWWKQYEL